jgi:hypothetical protein
MNRARSRLGLHTSYDDDAFHVCSRLHTSGKSLKGHIWLSFLSGLQLHQHSLNSNNQSLLGLAGCL